MNVTLILAKWPLYTPTVNSVGKRIQKLYLRNSITFFNVCDLNLDLITLMLKIDPDMIVTHLHGKMRSIDQKVQKLCPGKRQTDTQTDRQTHRRVNLYLLALADGNEVHCENIWSEQTMASSLFYF